MPWPMILMFAAFALVALAVWYFSHDQRLKRALRAQPLTPIDQLRSGQIARISGAVEAEDETLTSPFGHEPCVWYRATVEEYRQHGKSGSWRTIIREERGVDFAIGDGMSRARVRARDASVLSTRHLHGRSGTFDDASHIEQAFLQRHGRDSTGLLGFNRKLRYHEARLDLGERVTALGRVNAAAGGPPELRPDPELGLILSDHEDVAS